jgi:ketosteroid isomerase-like protein
MLYRLSLGLVCLALFSVPPALAQPSPEGDELIKLENAMGKAIEQHDGAALGRFLTDDFLYTDSDGQVWNKAQYIERTVKATITSVTLEDVTTRHYGDTGVVAARLKGKGSYGGGKGASIDLRFTDVWRKQEGRWQVAFTQETQRAKK